MAAIPPDTGGPCFRPEILAVSLFQSERRIAPIRAAGMEENMQELVAALPGPEAIVPWAGGLVVAAEGMPVNSEESGPILV